MPIQSYIEGPGTLKLDTGGTMDVSAQVTSCVVSADEKVDQDDAINVLSGDTIAGAESVTFEWKLAANLVQDIAAAGFVAWSWTNAGAVKTFEYIPNTVAGRKITGQVKIVPVSIGGDVKSRPTSDVTWRISGTPVLAASS